ncbi:MAG: GNAT family N-acetyltransferase [Dehalococcoidales bacterium]|nr:GNAT family N-acetyltransferase [Dehalococcoidales bacterium]
MMKLEKKQIKQASEMLAGAFKDEYKDIFHDHRERTVKELLLNEFYLRLEFPLSEVYITSPRMEGLALWMHSDKWKKRSFRRILTSGAIWQAGRVGAKPLKIILEQDRYIQKKHAESMPQEHWYLEILAVAPEHQGKGYGSRLMNEMLERIDEESLPCYVETDGKKNIAIYRHFGFEISQEFNIPYTSDKVVAMIRPPSLHNHSER